MRDGLPRQLAAGRLLFAGFLATTALSLVRAIDQPGVSVGVAGTTLDVVAGDVAVATFAVLLLATSWRALLAAASRHRTLVAATAAFSLWIVATAAENGSSALVSALKLVELVAVGVGVLALVDRDDRVATLLDLVLAATIAADVVGIYQYVRHGGGRVDAFLGTHDFAALATLPLLTMLAGFFAPRRWSRRTQVLAGVASWVGLTLTAALASLLGLYLGVAMLLALALRRRRLSLRNTAATAAVLVAVTIPTLLVRQNDLGFVHKWLGKAEKRRAEFASSWSQRLIYLYVGGRVWQAHPLAGTGWYGLLPPAEFARYVPDARARFPDNPAGYFPPVDRPFIPQQAFDQVLFELGLVGEALFLLLLGSAGAIGLRRASRERAPTVLDWLPVVFVAALVGALAGAALFGGTPLVALTWLTLTLPAAGRPA